MIDESAAYERPMPLRTGREVVDHASRSVDELPLLAAAKLAAPRLRRGIVRQPRLERALQTGADAALTLVAAPAGYGKTTVVRAACESTDSALAWVTLDAGDNDPGRLWTYLATAVDGVREGLGCRALHRLRDSGTAIEVAVDEVTNAIADFGRPFTLVLDDLHTVTDPACMVSLAHAVERLPSNARLIAITRADPALKLGRLRGRGALVELRASDLAFTAGEARELLVDRGGLRLNPEQIEVLRRRTEGWPAALCLAALWLRTVDDQDRAVLEFGGDHRYIAEYLSHEVLAALDADHCSFLLRAAALGSFTAELCDAVLGRSDSAAVLSTLEESNLFVQSLERREWFRVHALFAEFAVARLAGIEPGEPARIRLRAAGWLASRGLAVEAASHAAAVGDHRVVAELISEHHLALIRNGRAGTVLRWAETLPDDVLVEHPDAAVAAATAALLVGRVTLERRRLLALASHAKAKNPQRFGVYEACVMAIVRAGAIDGGVTDAVVEGHRAVELAESRSLPTLVAALASLAWAAYFGGDAEQAWGAAFRAVEQPDLTRHRPGHVVARSILALVAVDRGRLTTARAHADTAHAIVRKIASSRSWLGAITAEALGAVLAAEGDLAGAERELSHAERLVADDVATLHHARLLVRLAEVRCRRGRFDEADVTLRRADEALAELGDSGVVALLVADVGREIERARQQAGDCGILQQPTQAEFAVLQLLPTNLSAREIGARLFLSPNTVRSHTRALYRKLGVGSRDDAVARATALELFAETRSAA